MHDERDVARRAAPCLPARAAGQEVRPAAAVEQDDRLARVGQRLVRSGVKGPARLAHVDDLDRRQAGAVDARGQAHARQRVDRLGARRRAAGHQHCARLRGAALGHAARVVARIALVLVGRVVLLVDHDQAQPAHRGEHGRARADADARLPRPQPRPLVVALAGRELRVQDGDRVAEARDEARHDLRRQRDLGDEHDHAAAVREGLRGGPQVDLGLARPGDAVQQQPLARRGGDDRAQRRGLVGGQLRLRPRGADGDVQRARGARRAGRCSRARAPPAGAARGGRLRRSAAATRAARAGGRSGAPARRSPPTARPTARSWRACPSAAAGARARAPASSSTRPPSTARGRPARRAAAPRARGAGRQGRARRRRPAP